MTYFGVTIVTKRNIRTENAKFCLLSETVSSCFFFRGK